MLNEATRLNETWRSEHYSEVIAAEESFYNATAMDGVYLNVTTADTAAAVVAPKRPGPNLDGYYRVDVRIGKGSTHTGTLRKGRMFKRMYAALKDCGIAHHNPSIPGFCNEDRPECPDYCRLEGIVYDKGFLHYESDSYLILKMKYSYFNIRHRPKIQDLGVSTLQPV
jgi:hypothetical protein